MQRRTLLAALNLLGLAGLTALGGFLRHLEIVSRLFSSYVFEASYWCCVMGMDSSDRKCG